MYKFIYNNNVIDVVDKIKYLRYLEKSKRTVVTDSSSANCVQGSDNITGLKRKRILNYAD